VRFKPVLSFEDQETLDRIHLNYRLQYLKDIVLPRLLDDAAFVSLTQMIHTNLSVILDHVQRHQRLLEQLFSQIRQRDRQSLLFLQDVCRLAKQIAPSDRQALHEKMVAQQLFGSLVLFFSEEPAGATEHDMFNSRNACVEIILCSAQNDPTHLRRFLTVEGSAEGRTLLSILSCTLLHGEDQGVQGQVVEVFKAVMETSALDPRDRDSCLDTFYDRGALDELLAPLRVEAPGKSPAGVCSLFGQQLACELLAFAVAHHGYRARAYIMRHGLAQHAMRLLGVPHRFLQLAPVRLLRAIVATKDDAYHRYLCKSGMFASLLRAFQHSLRSPALGGNLLVSATLEVLECIRVDNIKLLVDHVCRKHEAVLREHAPKIRTLHLFLVRHEQNMEYEAFPPEQHTAGGPIVNTSGGATRSGRVRSPGREDSDDDEAYFESLDEDDVEDDATSGPSVASPGAITTETLPSQCSESPPSAHDVDAAAAAEGSPGSSEVVVNGTDSSGAIEQVAAVAAASAAAETGAATRSAGDPPTDGSMQESTSTRCVASESPPRSPGADPTTAATVANEIPNHAPKRLKTSASVAVGAPA
jgi:protein phosphatase-4 regulatory subunit 3